MQFLEIVDTMICSLFIKSNYLSYCDLEGEMYGPRLPEYKKYSPEKLKLLKIHRRNIFARIENYPN